MCYTSAKSGVKNQSTNNPYTQTEDVLCNPENPDSKPDVRGKFILKSDGVG
jgi:hypothetical protein